MSALLVPTVAELTHLCSIIPTYLKSTQLYIRNATLNGLTCLLECLVHSNTTMGGLSDELQLLRNVIINYTVKHGIVDERYKDGDKCLARIHQLFIFFQCYNVQRYSFKTSVDFELLFNRNDFTIRNRLQFAAE